MLSTTHPAFNRFRQAAHGRGGVPDIAETKTQRKHTSNLHIRQQEYISKTDMKLGVSF